MSSDEEEYEIVKRRAMAVIIVNENFAQPEAKRVGAKKDLEMTSETFKRLGFEVKDYFDQTATQMLHCIQKALQDKDIKQLDCFVCVISSHGYLETEDMGDKHVRNDWICGTDTEIKLDTLLKPATLEECPGLANKPKLFFIQGCRGGRASYQVQVQPGTGGGKGKPPIVDQWAVGATVQNIPLQKDFLLAWAVQPGFIAFHRPSGSWFIKGICKVLNAYADKGEELLQKHKQEKISKPVDRYMHEHMQEYDIVTLMTMINGYVATGKEFVVNKSGDPYLHAKKMMPWMANQLTKYFHLYELFLPK